jgi:Domain of unknown function (DUF1877)
MLSDQNLMAGNNLKRQSRSFAMGMQLDYKCFTPEEWAQMQTDDPITVTQWLCEGEPAFSLDKCWHVMHWLLTGDAGLDDDAFTEPPLGNVVMGGTDSKFEASYGQIRYLMPAEVQDVATALTAIPFADLSAKFDADAFNDAELYPLGRRGTWDDDEVAAEHEAFQTIYPGLVAFFQQAAQDRNVVLISLN